MIPSTKLHTHSNVIHNLNSISEKGSNSDSSLCGLFWLPCIFCNNKSCRSL